MIIKDLTPYLAITQIDPTGEIAPIIGIYTRCVGSCMLERCLIGAVLGDCEPCIENLPDCLTDCLNPFNLLKRSPKQRAKPEAGVRSFIIIFDIYVIHNTFEKYNNKRPDPICLIHMFDYV